MSGLAGDTTSGSATFYPNDNEIAVIKAVSDAMKNNVVLSGENNINALKVKNVNEWKLFNDNQVVPLRIEQYIMYAALLNEQQDLYAKNTTLTENQTTQVNMIDRILSDFHNKGYGSMREFQAYDYKVNLKKMQIKYVLRSTVVMAVLLILVGLTKMGVLDSLATIILGGFIILAYIVLIFLEFKQNQIRRKYDWDKMYWKSPSEGRIKSNEC